ncbi:MAG: HEAT repeat domain-containing protein [Magnetococcales bacterium]|nr:HEAT repeat domain-containing protein [Magnetococcales bacterium]
MEERTPPDALLVVAPGCPHCGMVLEGMSRLLKEGRLSSLQGLQAPYHAGEVSRLGIRSVPWYRIGPFVFEEAQGYAELLRWAERADHIRGMAVYFEDRLNRGQRHRVLAMVREDPARLQAFALLMADVEVGLQTRLGMGVVLEELQGSGLAVGLLSALERLVQHPEARMRGDACHFLSLIDCPRSALRLLEKSLDDPDPMVREVAGDLLEEMKSQAGWEPEYDSLP